MELSEFDIKLLAIVHSLRPFEKLTVKLDENGKPSRVVVMTESVTFLDNNLTIKAN